MARTTTNTPNTFVVRKTGLARELYELRRLSVGRCVDLSSRYGVGARISRLAHRLERDLSALRCELDGQLARDHPDDFEPGVYYPGATA